MPLRLSPHLLSLLVTAALFVPAIGHTAPFHPQPITLRMASVAPEGTAWARQIHAFTRNVETATQGRVRIRWYLGGIAGDEFAALGRIERGQLDGAAGALFCNRLSPSFRAMHVVGLFNGSDESGYTLGALKPLLENQFRQNGFTMLGTGGFGQEIIFSRRPIRSMADLRRQRLFVYSLDTLLVQQARDLGLHPVPLPLGDAAAAYDSGQIDGFIAPPSAALAFQWSARSRYFSELKTAYLNACMVVANRAFNRIAEPDRQAIYGAAAQFSASFDEVNRHTDEELLSHLLERQGVARVPVSPQFRAAFAQAARDVRSRIPADMVKQSLIEQVLALLADYRSEHR